jgi:hypothetical protein
MRKNAFFAGLLLLSVLIGMSSCEETNDQVIGDIEGTYEGSFSKSTSLKSNPIDGRDEHDGIAEVSMMGENQIQVHCFGNEIDTTFILDYYEHNNSVMVCLTGDDFKSTYGHMLGEVHMSGGMMGQMMGDIVAGETEWMHHMSDEHDEGDEHFGGFDMHDGTFSYSFHMMDNFTPYYLKFHGVKTSEK